MHSPYYSAMRSFASFACCPVHLHLPRSFYHLSRRSMDGWMILPSPTPLPHHSSRQLRVPAHGHCVCLRLCSALFPLRTTPAEDLLSRFPSFSPLPPLASAAPAIPTPCDHRGHSLILAFSSSRRCCERRVPSSPPQKIQAASRWPPGCDGQTLRPPFTASSWIQMGAPDRLLPASLGR